MLLAIFPAILVLLGLLGEPATRPRLADAALSAGALSDREPFAGLRDTREFRKEAGRNRLA